MSTKLAILDRDGVINEDSKAYIKAPEEWLPIPGSLEAIAQLNHHGYRVAIATNQSGIARGLFSIDSLNAIHHKLHVELSRIGGYVDGIFFCPHGPNDQCECRKPAPGLYEAIARRFDRSDLRGVPIIGDSLRDMEASFRVGGRSILVKTGNGRRVIQSGLIPENVEMYENLYEAVLYILKPGNR